MEDGSGEASNNHRKIVEHKEWDALRRGIALMSLFNRAFVCIPSHGFCIPFASHYLLISLSQLPNPRGVARNCGVGPIRREGLPAMGVLQKPTKGSSCTLPSTTPSNVQQGSPRSSFCPEHHCGRGAMARLARYER